MPSPCERIRTSGGAGVGEDVGEDVGEGSGLGGGVSSETGDEVTAGADVSVS